MHTGDDGAYKVTAQDRSLRKTGDGDVC